MPRLGAVESGVAASAIVCGVESAGLHLGRACSAPCSAAPRLGGTGQATSRARMRCQWLQLGRGVGTCRLSRPQWSGGAHAVCSWCLRLCTRLPRLQSRARNTSSVSSLDRHSRRVVGGPDAKRPGVAAQRGSATCGARWRLGAATARLSVARPAWQVTKRIARRAPTAPTRSERAGHSPRWQLGSLHGMPARERPFGGTFPRAEAAP